MTDSNKRRLLRWVFLRGHQQVTCELALDNRVFLYEFSVTRGKPPASKSVDRFPEASQAFERQCQYEAALIKEGYTLHAYESRGFELAVG